MVECGVGVGVVPQTTAARAAKTMALCVVELTDDWALRELTIVVRAAEELRPYARELVDSLRT
jgi:DNA-binding transcriptional LysR family regulator